MTKKERSHLEYVKHKSSYQERARKYYKLHKEELKKRSSEYSKANRKRIERWRKVYYLLNHTRIRAHRNSYRKKKAESFKEYQRRYVLAHKQECLARTKAWARSLRLEVLRAYGHSCICCGENREPFLTIEHTNGDGAHHRRLVKRKVYRDLKLRGFPKDGYAVMCWNCNCASSRGRLCPHKLGVSVES